MLWMRWPAFIFCLSCHVVCLVNIIVGSRTSSVEREKMDKWMQITFDIRTLLSKWVGEFYHLWKNVKIWIYVTNEVDKTTGSSLCSLDTSIHGNLFMYLSTFQLILSFLVRSMSSGSFAFAALVSSMFDYGLSKSY